VANLKSFKGFAMLMACAAIFFISSCKKEEVNDMVGETVPKKIALDIPANFPAVLDDPDNPLTEQGVALGRLLFYDTRLSGSNKLSCASCHHQELAFSDGISLSNIGESGQPLPRHAPALINLAWAKSGFFWDGGSTNLESQAFGPLTSADEMHQNLSELEDELKAVPDYAKRFKDAFGTGVKSANIVKALAQFERTLISGNSRYDKYIRKENGSVLTDPEIRGMALVNAKCRSCHAGELFSDDGFHNNGIDKDFSNASLDGLYQGRSRITYNPLDLGKFKTPTLRNVALTSPYMHDGRIKTLAEVIEHYNSGIQVSPTTDVLLFQNNGQAGIPLSLQDKRDIIAFLNTLTDEDFIRNKKFNKPNLP
jgi:cytochrome c peroxidase